MVFVPVYTVVAFSRGMPKMPILYASALGLLVVYLPRSTSPKPEPYKRTRFYLVQENTFYLVQYSNPKP